jgi:hypothetical protein
VAIVDVRDYTVYHFEKPIQMGRALSLSK